VYDVQGPSFVIITKGTATYAQTYSEIFRGYWLIAKQMVVLVAEKTLLHCGKV
jgi:hypothetical protein